MDMKEKEAQDIEHVWWTAVTSKDRSKDGEFYYGVVTTGVYCRPGCSSRTPNRNNVQFFRSRRDAEAAGFRPCKKCFSGVVSKEAGLEMKVVNACRRIEQSDAPVLLRDLAAEAELSPSHFHRIFKRMVGITPKQYYLHKKSHNFRKQLQVSSSVTEAIYATGYSSSSRAYEKGSDQLSMQPKVFRNGGIGMKITYGIAECNLGWLVVAATERGVCLVEFGEGEDTLAAVVQKSFPKAIIEKGGRGFASLIQRVVLFVNSPHEGSRIPLDIQGTAFQQRVWDILRQIKPGKTLSYTEVAERVGNPKAARAVATACGANKIAVLIPCHRVISADGKPGGYKWGVETKLQLLEAEKGKVGR